MTSATNLPSKTAHFGPDSTLEGRKISADASGGLMS